MIEKNKIICTQFKFNLLLLKEKRSINETTTTIPNFQLSAQSVEMWNFVHIIHILTVFILYTQYNVTIFINNVAVTHFASFICTSTLKGENFKISFLFVWRIYIYIQFSPCSTSDYFAFTLLLIFKIKSILNKYHLF